MVNKLKEFVLKSEDNQYEDDGKDGEESTSKGADEYTLYGYTYNNAQKQLTLSPTLLEDRVWIDEFQAGSIAVSIEQKHARGQYLVTSREEIRQIYCNRKEWMSNIMTGRIVSIREEWIIYNCGIYIRSIPILQWKQGGNEETRKGDKPLASKVIIWQSIVLFFYFSVQTI